MKRLAQLTLIITLLLIIIINLNAQAQKKFKELKIGVVNIEEVVKAIPEATEADKKLQEVTLQYRDSLASIEKDFVEKAEKYQKQKAMMTPEQQQKEEEALQKIQINYQKFQQEKFGNTGEIAQLRESLLAPIRNKIKKAIEKVAKDEEISLVLDAASPTLLYFENNMELTYRVIDILKRGTE